MSLLTSYMSMYHFNFYYLHKLVLRKFELSEQLRVYASGITDSKVQLFQTLDNHRSLYFIKL